MFPKPYRQKTADNTHADQQLPLLFRLHRTLVAAQNHLLEPHDEADEDEQQDGLGDQGGPDEDPDGDALHEGEEHEEGVDPAEAVARVEEERLAGGEERRWRGVPDEADEEREERVREAEGGEAVGDGLSG